MKELFSVPYIKDKTYHNLHMIVRIFHFIFCLLIVYFINVEEGLAPCENLSGLRIIFSKPQDVTGVIMEK